MSILDFPPLSAGKGALVLAPGMLCDDGVWEAQIEGLRDLARCIVPDYRGEPSITAMAEVLLAEAPERFALAGHSMGGRVALEAMRLAPQRIERLCLMGTEAQPRPVRDAQGGETAERLHLLTIARERGMRAVGLEWLPSLVEPGRLGDQTLVESILAMVERQTPEILESQIEAGFHRPDSTAVLPTIRSPVLILCGREDRIRPLRAHEEMARLVTDSRLVVVERCGHMLTMERPDAVVRAMREWLVRAPQPAGAGA